MIDLEDDKISTNNLKSFTNTIKKLYRVKN